MDFDFSFAGDNPKARFGHTITQIGKQRAILFGGAVGGDSGSQYTITGDTYLCEFGQKRFKKLECQGMAPSNRAAHAAICIEHFLFVYGGAMGGGQLADDTLYQLDVLTLSDKARWTMKNCSGQSPGPRYGHVLGYLRPFIIIHGGNTGSEPVGDVWVNEIMGDCQWRKVDTGDSYPPSRVYHSASICRTGTANGMMVIFGGRGADGKPLNDTWGLRKHRDNRLDWMKAPYRNTSAKPTQRYQHRTLFIGTLLMIIGGRCDVVGESMPLDIYDTDTSQWHKLLIIDRFRHVCFLVEDKIYIHGGFDQEFPNVPKDSILKLDLSKIFASSQSLYRGLAYELGRDFLTHRPVNSRRSSNEDRNFYSQQQNRRSSGNDEHHHISRRNQDSNKPIRLCPQVIAANFNQENDVKKISIEDLPSQHKKLGESNINSASKDSTSVVVASYYLQTLFLRANPQLKFPLAGESMNQLLFEVEKVLKEKTTVLRIRAPVKVFGDIHGQPGELNRMFEAFGAPCEEQPLGDIEHTNYLFLGDYVDRGTKSLETIIMLFSLQIKYPDSISLLRGSHEDRNINRSMGLGDECQHSFKQNIDDPGSYFSRINKVFDLLPLAAVVDDSIFCAHGGIGSTATKLDEIHRIQRPLQIALQPKTKVQKIVFELLWSDPCRDKQLPNSVNVQHDYLKRKNNLKFSQQRTESFCSNNDYITIIRSSQPMAEGYESKQSLITVFSSSDYGGAGNKSSIIEIKKNMQLEPMVLNPIPGQNRWINPSSDRRVGSQDDFTLRNASFTPPK